VVHRKMEDLVFIGDAHAKFDQMLACVSEDTDAARIYQVGDFGIGFKPVPSLPQNFRFIRGNHDNPALAKAHENFLGDYGVDEFGVGYLGGAHSVDEAWLVPGVSWWRDEELSLHQLQEAIDDLVEAKPEIMITHSAPSVFKKELVLRDIPNRTDQALDELVQRIKPRYWICGHYHTSLDLKINGTHFVCLNELETLRLGDY